MTHANKPDVRLSLQANEKINHWVELADGEVSGLGYVDPVCDEDGIIEAFEIDDVFLLDQVSTKSNTELDPQAVAEFLVEADEDGHADRVHLWWHSHGEMDVFWSSTDEACIEGMGGEPYLVSLVVNKAGERRARLDVFRPVRVTLDRLETSVTLPSLGLREQCEREFDEKVHQPPLHRFRRRRPSKRSADHPGDFLHPETQMLTRFWGGSEEYDFVDEGGEPVDCVDYFERGERFPD
jgi:hypothetical protein